MSARRYGSLSDQLEAVRGEITGTQQTALRPATRLSHAMWDRMWDQTDIAVGGSVPMRWASIAVLCF
jgi:hypothetical protein